MADVTVRGAGIFGLSVAWACAARGARVQIVDPGGVGAGASGGIVGALAPHVPENWNAKKAFQLAALLMAETFWAEIGDISGCAPGYTRAGRLQPVADAAALALARARARTAPLHWHAHATWEVIPADRDWAPFSPAGWLIHDTLSARLHPRRACAALATALERRGISVTPDAPDRGAVIWATGAAGLAALSRDLGQPVGGAVKGQAALLGLSLPPDAPQLFAGGLHIVPHGDGTVAVGSTSERDFADPCANDAQLDDVIARARQVVPALGRAPVIERWAGLRPRARSRAPMIGHWPGRPGHFIANGGFKIGLAVAPMLGSVLADLVLEGKNAVPGGFDIAASLK